MSSIIETLSPASEEEIKTILKSLPNKTCSLDSFPTWLIIQCANELTPVITYIVNVCLESGEMPGSLKRAVVRPLLKKTGLDKEDFNNYRPVSNLAVMSKIIEKVVASRLKTYLNANNLSNKYQSAYKANHSTETALLRVLNDIICLQPNKHPIMLVLLDLSAAFDTVDKHILFERLYSYFGIRGTALRWFQSYMSDRTMSVAIENQFSKSIPVRFGVPQGSVLGPILFTMYTTPLCDIILDCGFDFHIYADDIQIYLPLNKQNTSLELLEDCLERIKLWMAANKLKLNESKTEVILFSTHTGPSQADVPAEINFSGEQIIVPTNVVVRNLGVYLDTRLSMDHHIKKTCQACHYQLRNIGKIRNIIDTQTAQLLVHCFITSRLDYCNSLLKGIPKYHLERLQKLHNKAARIVKKSPLREDSKELLKGLHWLPVEHRIDFKLACLIFKCLNGLAPPYLDDLIEKYQPTKSLRSAGQNLKKNPRERA